MITLPDVSREEWVNRRKDYIGSSEVATILGLNPYSTPLQLWCSKTGRLPDSAQNDYMLIGTHLEPVVANIFQRREGKPVAYVGKTFVHDSIEWASATPDYWLLDTDEKPAGILECKTTSFYNEAKWEDGIPNGAHCQTIWQLGVTGMKDAYVACLVGADPNKFYSKAVPFDESIWDQMVDCAGKFMAMVKSDTPPEAKGADIKLLQNLEPKKEEVLHLDDISDLLREWNDLQGGMDVAKKTSEMIQDKLTDIRAKIVQHMAGHATAVCDKWTITNKRVNRGEHVVHASSYDRFMIKETK
jgi:putative phage-type endonuclease